jgi:HEPN domain-containing protein
LRHARSDLALARARGAPEILLESLCFHAQQAVEKALKAVLVAQGIGFPRTHNIGVLLDLIPSHSQLSARIQAADILTDYAVSSRYPADVEPVSEAEYQEAIRLAELVINWATERTSSSGTEST